MKTLKLLTLLVITAAAGCEAEVDQSECGAEDVDIILNCGPKNVQLFDQQGREIDFCRIPTNEGRECTFGTVHCMPRSYCESLCQDGVFVCD